MKFVLSTALVLGSLHAFAGEFSKPSSVLFESASTWVEGLNVCRDGNFLKHKKKDAVKVKYCQGNAKSGVNCKVVTKKLLQPVRSQTLRCSEFSGKEDSGCVQWEEYVLDQTSVILWGYKSKKDLEQDDHGRIIGKYTIPSCGTGIEY